MSVRTAGYRRKLKAYAFALSLVVFPIALYASVAERSLMLAGFALLTSIFICFLAYEGAVGFKSRTRSLLLIVFAVCILSALGALIYVLIDLTTG